MTNFDKEKEMYTIIHNNFSILLAKKLIKISQVSKDTGISRTTLRNLYYRRTTSISLYVVNKLCSYLNCEVGDIFEFKEDK